MIILEVNKIRGVNCGLMCNRTNRSGIQGEISVSIGIQVARKQVIKWDVLGE